MSFSSAHVYAVIMAGGVGTRLWPWSRDVHPKQFIDLLDQGSSLLQRTYQQVLRHVDRSRILVVTHLDHVHLVAAQLPELPEEQILAEPLRRNTAPCIAYASYRIWQSLDEDTRQQTRILVTPADHYIPDTDAFDRAIQQALEAATPSRLLTLGICPTRPDTGYGYIQFEQDDHSVVKSVRTFTEKPEAALAQQFLESGDFLWNSGIFAWQLPTIIEALERHAPEVAEIFSEGLDCYHSSKERGFLEKAYALAPTISIDYAVMEKYEGVFVVPCQFVWSDLGSWEALYDVLVKRKGENILLNGTEKLLFYESEGNLLHANSKKLLLIDGLKDYLIADFDDVLIICPRQSAATFRRYVRDVQSLDTRYT